MAVAVVALLVWTIGGHDRPRPVTTATAAPTATVSPPAAAPAGSGTPPAPPALPTMPSAAAPTASPDGAAPEAPAQEAAARERALQSAVDAAEAVADQHEGVDIGAAVLDLGNGDAATGDAGAAPFYAASIAKLLTVVDVLHRAETGEVVLTDTDTERIQRALQLSDDSAMNLLWETFGGAATITDTIGLAGLTGSAPPGDPAQWGETTVTAADVLDLYRYVLDDLSPGHRDLVLGALRGAADTAADGFDQAFGLIAPPRAEGVAAKQGWMWIGDEFYLHTSGLVDDDHYVVAVLSRHTASLRSPVARAVVNAATAAALNALPADG